jgi:hypothetical protein
MNHCIYCNYTAKLNSDFSKHNKTTKHFNNVEIFKKIQEKIILACPFCNQLFTTENDKIIHLDTCKKLKQNKKIIVLTNANKTLNDTIKIMSKTIKNLNKDYDKLKSKYEKYIIKLQENNIKYVENIKNQHTENIENIKNQHTLYIENMQNKHNIHIDEIYSINTQSLQTMATLAIKEIRTKYPSAPLLEQMNNELANKIIEDTFKKGDTLLRMYQRIVFYFKDKQLIKLLGEQFIINYKKQNPNEQAVWNTDTARLNYIIRELVNNSENWVVDKFGEKMKQLLITPVGQEIRIHVFTYKNILCENMKSLNNTSQTLKKIQDDINVCLDLIFYIDEKKFEDHLCKFMAPNFYYKNNITTKKINIINNTNNIDCTNNNCINNDINSIDNNINCIDDDIYYISDDI